VTVGRFRQFVRAVVQDGWSPTPGAGKHLRLNGGKGLAVNGGGFEPGWKGAWPQLAAAAADWDTNLECGAGKWTWTSEAGPDENEPINCESWYEAYAFCIYDGGFLPSEAEWNFVASTRTRRTRRRATIA
jgi:formylglycine-generating enzyme required for sulfatase activity